jgi:hypothetical protein
MFSACRNCVAPKRHPGCHDSCPEYRAERAEYDERKAIHDRKHGIDKAIYEERTKKVTARMKRRKNKKI